MIKDKMYVKIQDGGKIPAVFLGTVPFHEMGDYNFRRLRVMQAVGYGIIKGYGIYCAVAYENHRQVGNGIRLSGVDRKDIFLTSKLYNTQQDNYVKEHYDRVLEEIGVKYLDLLLLHWPQSGTYVNAWKQMEELYQSKRVKYIGIANVEIRHLETLTAKGCMLPHVIQVERNPLNTQSELCEYCKEKELLFRHIRLWED